MILAFLCIVFLLTIFIGIPLAWAIIVSTLAPLLAFNRGYPLESIYLNLIAGIEPTHYIAKPMFIVAGEMISRGGVGLRIVTFSRTLFGFLPGGLGICVVASSMIFGGISGSAIADSAAIGSNPGHGTTRIYKSLFRRARCGSRHDWYNRSAKHSDAGLRIR